MGMVTDLLLASIKSAKDVECSVILHSLGEFPLACVLSSQDDFREMWLYLHERYSARTTGNKSVLHLALSRLR